MGQRVNLIITRSDGEYDLYYNHWCANTLPVHLFWGPEYAEAFIRNQTLVDESRWLNDIWAEGGVVMDAGNQVLLFYGGEDIQNDIPLRKHYLALMQQVWEGWELRWGYEGIADLAGYVRFPIEKVIASREVDRGDMSLSPPSDLEWTDTIGSIRFEDGELLLFPLDGGGEGYLLCGQGMIQSIRRGYGYPRINLGEWTEDFPTDGFHIDAVEKTIDLWHAGVYSNLVQRLQPKWAGWRISDHYCDYEKQVEITNGRMVVPLRDRDAYLLSLSQILLKERGNPLNSLSEVIERLSQAGKKVEVSPWAYAHEQYEVPLDVRKSILLKAIHASNKIL
ncbi:hypothetical protein ACFPPD_22770 [Cohnella suwonensis]|uniref:Uncharacterized protein n=1 Tax=Cohnella suwonensis TaxID=696072 RepID=A0ABW0M2T7_9BACL